MLNNDNFVKLLALSIVGGVAKALFGPPRVYNTVTNQVAKSAGDAATEMTKSFADKALKG